MLTLAIGGVGIMNIMFVNVQERTREIGVRKALGATRQQILLQFLLEGLVTTFAGGSIGIACRTCWSGCSARGRFWPNCSTIRAGSPTFTWCCRRSWWAVCTSILMMVGLVAGLLPAIKASRLDPIEALRYE